MKRICWLLVVLIVPTEVGCRSGSGSSGFQFLKSFHSTKPNKSDGLIAAVDNEPPAAPDKTNNAGAFSLASYSAEVARPETESRIHEAELPLLLARLVDESEAISSPSDRSATSELSPTNHRSSGSHVEDGSIPGSAIGRDQSALSALPEQSNAIGNVNGELDLQALESMALANNPSLAEQQALVDSLRGRWVQAGLRPNPTLGFSGQQLFSQGQAEQIGIFAGQKIIRSEKISADQQVVCREMEVALQNLAIQQRRVLTDVRIKYYEVLIAQRRRQVTDELVKIANESLEKTQSLFKAELGTKIDVLRSTVELQETAMQHQTAQNQLVSSWKQLVAVVGQPDLPLQTVQGSIVPTLNLEQDTLLLELIQDSPEIASTIAQRQRAQAQLRRAIVEPLPDIEVQSIVQHDNAIDGTDANLQVTIPVPFRNRNQGAIAEARMQLTAAHFAQQKTELGLQERLAEVWQRYESAQQQVEVFAKPDGILSNSRKTLELIRKAYNAGEIGSLELITAQRVYSQTSLQYLTALGDYWSSKIELEGQLLKGSLQN